MSEHSDRRRGSVEVIAGVVTFATMSSILFVQPAVMTGTMTGTPTGMPPGPLITTTCLASALASILMGVVGRCPIGMAPAMGENFFVVLTVIPLCARLTGVDAGDPEAWRLALGVVFLSGVLFFLLSLLNVRRYLIDAISPGMRSAIASGLGLFIALIGLRNAGVVVSGPDGYVFGSLTGTDAVIFASGLVAIVTFQYWRIRGGMLWGILIAAMVATLLGRIEPGWPIGLPYDPRPVLCQADISTAVAKWTQLFPLMAILVFMEVFGTLGTLVGVCESMGLRGGPDELPDVRRVFLADAGSTMLGALCGHSTLTSYIESCAGTEAGGRTGIVAIVTGGCFLGALFFTPLIVSVAGCLPITSSALVVVGTMMMRAAGQIDWNDPAESVPAFLVMTGMPFFGNIADGLIPGFVLYPVLKLLCGRGRQTRPATWGIAVVLILYLGLREWFS
ncbi:MAG: NCS2 family permease [Planctomycetia bacterium]|nr:NCS2 family permease [Planctomycetia bacterium]